MTNTTTDLHIDEIIASAKQRRAEVIGAGLRRATVPAFVFAAVTFALLSIGTTSEPADPGAELARTSVIDD